MNPYFTISLDFELMWGIIDSPKINNYKEYVLGVRELVPELLKLFKKYNIHVTWAVVGFITFENKDQIFNYIPKVLPEYNNPKLNPYIYLKNIGKNEKVDPLHYAYSLLNKIIDTDGMEIGSHTFSHFYCLEPNKQNDSFLYDTEASIANFDRLNLSPKSFVFCKNQFNENSLSVIEKFGFQNYRGNVNHFLYNSRSSNQENILIKTSRYLDSYINLSGNNESVLKKDSFGMNNINASKFLRPIEKNSSYFAINQINRIKNSMEYCAINNLGYHLWWHPFNFGKKIKENLTNLESILIHFKNLEQNYNMRSLNMNEINKQTI